MCSLVFQVIVKYFLNPSANSSLMILMVVISLFCISPSATVWSYMRYPMFEVYSSGSSLMFFLGNVLSFFSIPGVLAWMILMFVLCSFCLMKSFECPMASKKMSPPPIQ